VAEGIEDHRQLARLRELGCLLGQGYLFARPLPAHDVTELLRGAGQLAA
jgi:EAL domain-containing protein (putative c-di-GMP-specific phosphodiesterase class I)